MDQRGVGRHYDRWQRRKVCRLRRRRDLFDRMRWGVVGEDLIDAENNIGEQEGAFHRVPAAAPNTPSAQYHSASDRHADQSGVNVGDFREAENAPEEIDRAGYDGGGQNQETDLIQSLIRALAMRFEHIHTIQLSLLPPRLTSQRVICPAACMTNKLQKPSTS